MQGPAERVRRVPADRTVAEVVARLTDIETQLNGFFAPGGPRRPRSRRCPTASPASTACTSRSPRRSGDALPTFENPAFIERLDILFAEFYFDAYDAAAAQAWVSKAWEPLFKRRAEHRLALQFAIAGMNAHINNDLAHALVLTWNELGFDAGDAARDYDKVNDILERGGEGHQGPALRRSDRRGRPARSAPPTTSSPSGASATPATRRGSAPGSCSDVDGNELDGLFDRIVGFAGNLLLGPAV